MAFLTLILRQHPNVCSDACVVEQVNGKCDDCFDQVIFKQSPSNLALTRRCTARKQLRAVLDDCSSTDGIVHSIHSRLNENAFGRYIDGSIVPHCIYLLINHCKTPLYQMAV